MEHAELALTELIDMMRAEPRMVAAARLCRDDPDFVARANEAAKSELGKTILFALTVQTLCRESMRPGLKYLSAGGHLLALIEIFPELILFNARNSTKWGVN